MVKVGNNRIIAISLIFSFILFSTPYLLAGKDAREGNLLGFVYTPDRTTPMEGAVLKLRNVSTGVVYESFGSDNLGVVRVEGIEEGLYIVGISIVDGDYNLENLIGIRAERTAKFSVALKPGVQEQTAEGGEKSSECPRGEWYLPETAGVCDDGYEWDADNNRCECEKNKSFFAFFATPVGIALISAFAIGTTVGVVTLSEATTGNSPYK